MNEYNLKGYYFVDGYTYTKLDGMTCLPGSAQFNTLEEAKEACNLDNECISILEFDCQNIGNQIGLENNLFVCRDRVTYRSSAVSCLYEKGNIWYFVATLRTQHK